MSPSTEVKERSRIDQDIHDDSDDETRPGAPLHLKRRAVCPGCRMLMSVRETLLGKCGTCGTKLQMTSGSQ